MHGTSNPLVSVIIPVRDDPDGIRLVLDCLAHQTFPKNCFEVIIGDDGSQPGLKPRLEHDEGRIRVISGPPRTSYAARNMAASVAKGSVLAFCDADCLPDPGWLEEGLAALEEGDIVAGEVKFCAPPKPTVWSLLTIDMFLDQRQNVILSRGVTANLLVRRQWFDDLCGFDQSMPSGGDYDFVTRTVERGARLRYSPLAVVGHPTMDTARVFLDKVWRTNFWAGARQARRKARMDPLGVLLMVPVLGVVMARRRALRPAFCLDRERLETAGLKPRLWDQVLAVLALYGLVCYVAGMARAAGWVKGLLQARAGEEPVYAHPPAQDRFEKRETKGNRSCS